MTGLETRLEAANAVVATAAVVGLDLFHRRAQFALEEKGAKEFVTEADRQLERLVRERLAILLPDDAVMGEEMGGATGRAFWSVDPIDGTANFLRGSPLWGISLGYVEDGRSTVGVICYPALGVTLAAARGLGVWHQGQPFHRHVDFGGVQVVGVGDSLKWVMSDATALQDRLRSDQWAIAAYRCASLGLGFAALGYTDGYVENRLSIWDVAAGAVICAEAGLVVRQGGDLTSSGMWICAAVPAVQELLAPQLAGWAPALPS